MAMSSARPAPMSASRAWRAACSIPPRRAMPHRRSRSRAEERQGPRRLRDRFRHLAAKGCARGSGILVYDVPNRGNKRIFNLLDDFAAGDPLAPTTRRPKRMPGSASVSGAAIRWCGRAGTPARRAPMRARRRVPATLENGKPITGRIRDEFHFGTRAPGDGSVRRLSYRLPQPISPGAAHGAESGERAADRNRARRLGIHRRALDPAVAEAEISSRSRSTTVVRASGQRCSASLCERTRSRLVLALYERRSRRHSNPLLSEMSEIRHALAFGVSQSGRFLRHFLELA